MLRRFYLLELGLFFLSVLLGWQLYQMHYVTGGGGGGTPTAIPLERTQEIEAMTVLDREIPLRASYEIIAKKNLFNPTRKEKWALKKKIVKPPPPQKPPRIKKIVPKPRIVKKRNTLVLEGIVIFGDYRVALVRDMAKPRDGVKRLEVGALIDSYKVDSILEEKLVLKEEGGSEEILTLYAPDRSVRRKHGKTRITRTQPRRAPPATRQPPPSNTRRNPVVNQANSRR